MKEHPTDRMTTERLEALSRDLSHDPPCEYVREGLQASTCAERRCVPESGRCCYACSARVHVARALQAFRAQAVAVATNPEPKRRPRAWVTGPRRGE